MRVYRSVNLGSDGIASLLGLDGFIRAHGSASGMSEPETFGKSISGAEVFKRYREHPSGSYWNSPPRSIRLRASSPIGCCPTFR